MSMFRLFYRQERDRLERELKKSQAQVAQHERQRECFLDALCGPLGIPMSDNETGVVVKVNEIVDRLAELEHAVRDKDQRIRELDATVVTLNRSACKDADQIGKGES